MGTVYKDGTILVDNVYNTGRIMFDSTGTNVIGGICGTHRLGNTSDIPNTSYLRNAYNIGSIEGTGSGTMYVGSIYGYTNPTTIIENCYYLQNSQYQGIGQNGSSNSEINEFTEDSKKELVEKLNKTSNIWKNDIGNINNGYPVLQWQHN